MCLFYAFAWRVLYILNEQIYKRYCNAEKIALTYSATNNVLICNLRKVPKIALCQRGKVNNFGVDSATIYAI